MYKKEVSSDYSGTILFYGHFYDTEINDILEILNLFFARAVWCWPELYQLLQFELMILDLPVGPMLQSHHQFSLIEGCLSARLLQWTKKISETWHALHSG